MHSKFLSVSLLLLLAPASCSLAIAQPAPSTRYVPPTAFAGIEFLPKATLATPKMEIMPRELISLFGEKEFGVDLLELERITVVVEPFTDAQQDEAPEAGVIFRFSSPQELGGNFVQVSKLIKKYGRTSYLLDEDTTLLVLDDRTFLAGSHLYVSKMLSSRTATSKLIESLNSSNDAAHFSMHIVVEPIRPLLENLLPPADQLPPPFGRYLKLLDWIESISYSQNFDNKEVRQLVITCVDANSTRRVVNLIDSTIEFAKTAILSWVAFESGIEDPDYQEAIMKYAERLANYVRTVIQPEVDGNQITFTFKAEHNSNLNTIATTGIMIGMILPAVQQVREAARRTEASNQLRVLAIAAHNYAEENDARLPAQASFDENGKPLLSWRVHLLPFMGYGDLFRQFHLDEPWDSPHNRQLLNEMPREFRNPNIAGTEPKTVFLAVTGNGTLFEHTKAAVLSEVSTSSTAMFVEADESEAVFWTEPRDWNFDAAAPLRGLGNLRPAGFNVVFADGSTHLVSKTVDPVAWIAMCQAVENDE